MTFTVGDTDVSKVFLGATPVDAVYLGDEKVWPTAPADVTIRMTFKGASYSMYNHPVPEFGVAYSRIYMGDGDDLDGKSTAPLRNLLIPGNTLTVAYPDPSTVVYTGTIQAANNTNPLGKAELRPDPGPTLIGAIPVDAAAFINVHT